MGEVVRCWVCGGNLLREGQRVSCLMCGRGTADTVSLGEALLGSAIPETPDSGWVYQSGPRKEIPIELSLERAAKWARGEEA